MKLTRTRLNQIIREEKAKVLKEAHPGINDNDPITNLGAAIAAAVSAAQSARMPEIQEALEELLDEIMGL